MIQIFRNPKFNFMGVRVYGYLFSGIILIASIAGLWMHRSRTGDMLNYGIDFRGGTLMQVRFASRPDVGALREQLRAAGFASAAIQTYGKPEENSILIRVGEHLEANRDLVANVQRALRPEAERAREATGLVDLNTVSEQSLAELFQRAATGADNPSLDPRFVRAARAVTSVRANQPGGRLADLGPVLDVKVASTKEGEAPEPLAPELVTALKDQTYLGSLAFLRTESVGPAVGAKLRTQALWASLVANGLILVYLWSRFELRFGVAAVLCLVHDVVFITGVFAFTGREFDLTVLAAILTVIGYSVNDTVVVFDRVRTNLKLMKKERLETVLNASINQTLSRTVLTSGLTLLVVISLFLFGGEVLNGFAFALLIGIVEGTYSSIFVASPLLLAWDRFVQKTA